MTKKKPPTLSPKSKALARKLHEMNRKNDMPPIDIAAVERAIKQHKRSR